MEYEEFIYQFQSMIEARVGGDKEVRLQTMKKNNNTIQAGVSIISKESRIAPVIYLEYYYLLYKNGTKMEEVLREFIGRYQEASEPEWDDFSFFEDYEEVRPGIICKLINAEKNAELLNEVTYVPYLDLAVVFYYRLDHPVLGSGGILIKNDMLKRWGISHTELILDALSNLKERMPYTLTKIGMVLKKSGVCISDIDLEKSSDLYVLTNEIQYFGAVSIILDSILHEIAEQIGENYYILPSSIHECIIVPASMSIEPTLMVEMVKEINQEHVAIEDQLSDHVYYYNDATCEVKML